MKKQKAQITPFFAILLLLTASLFGAAYESARISGLKLYIFMSAQSSLESVFGEYDRKLFDDYGLLFYGKGQESMEEGIMEYLSYYEDVKKETGLEPSMSSPYSFQKEAFSVDNIVFATDGNGKAFEEQAIQAVGARWIEEGAKEILDYFDMAQSCGRFMEELKKIQEKGEEIIQLEKKYQEMKTVIFRIREEQEKIMELWERLEEAFRGQDEAGMERLKGELLEKYRSKEPFLSQLEELVAGYFSQCMELEQAKEQVKAVILQARQSLPDLLVSILEECGQAVLDYVTEDGAILSAVEAWEREIQKADRITKWLSGKELPEQTEQIKSLAQSLFEGETEEKEEASDTGFSLLDSLEGWREKGILAAVAPEASSERTIEGEDLPSFLAEEEKGEQTDPASSLLFQEYLFSYLEHFGDGKGRYDVEYIIGNHSSDMENLQDVAGQLILLREGLNLAYLFTDQQKRGEASAAALGIAGVTGLPFLKPVAEWIILGGWAFVEALYDVRCLFSGGGVPFWKTAQTWHTSLDALLSSEILEGEKRKDGMDYEIYLRLLLLFKKPEEKRLRAMDVIQWNMQKAKPDFRFSRCIGQIKINLICHAPSIFGPYGGGYRLGTVLSYHY